MLLQMSVPSTRYKRSEREALLFRALQRFVIFVYGCLEGRPRFFGPRFLVATANIDTRLPERINECGAGRHISYCMHKNRTDLLAGKIVPVLLLGSVRHDRASIAFSDSATKSSRLSKHLIPLLF